MMPDTLTVAQVADLLNTVVAGIRVGGAHEDRVFTLPEVHARTGWALSTLEEDCRLGRIDYTQRGRSIGLTSSQIAALIAESERRKQPKFATGSKAADNDELAQVRAAAQRARNRKSPRKSAA